MCIWVKIGQSKDDYFTEYILVDTLFDLLLIRKCTDKKKKKVKLNVCMPCQFLFCLA